MKIKKGDEVIIVAGKDKGATGTVLRALPQRERVVVEGANLMKKHKRANQTSGGQGEVVTQEAPLHISNVALVEDGQPTRAGYRFDEDGTKIRISRRTGKDI